AGATTVRARWEAEAAATRAKAATAEAAKRAKAEALDREVKAARASAERALATFADGQGEPPWELAADAFRRAGDEDGVRRVAAARAKKRQEDVAAVASVIAAARAGKDALARDYGGPDAAVHVLSKCAEPEAIALLA